LRVYDLRHTYASLLISQGVHVKAIAERMGHSSVTVTMEVYGHLLPSIEEHANQALERLYQQARNRPEATVTRLRREPQ
jgi:integrase